MPFGISTGTLLQVGNTAVDAQKKADAEKANKKGIGKTILDFFVGAGSGSKIQQSEIVDTTIETDYKPYLFLLGAVLILAALGFVVLKSKK